MVPGILQRLPIHFFFSFIMSSRIWMYLIFVILTDSYTGCPIFSQLGLFRLALESFWGDPSSLYYVTCLEVWQDVPDSSFILLALGQPPRSPCSFYWEMILEAIRGWLFREGVDTLYWDCHVLLKDWTVRSIFFRIKINLIWVLVS